MAFGFSAVSSSNAWQPRRFAWCLCAEDLRDSCLAASFGLRSVCCHLQSHRNRLLHISINMLKSCPRAEHCGCTKPKSEHLADNPVNTGAAKSYSATTVTESDSHHQVCPDELTDDSGCPANSTAPHAIHTSLQSLALACKQRFQISTAPGRAILLSR